MENVIQAIALALVLTGAGSVLFAFYLDRNLDADTRPYTLFRDVGMALIVAGSLIILVGGIYHSLTSPHPFPKG